VLEKVPEEVVSALGLRNRVGSRCVQLPGAVTELGTGLADVKVADLSSFALAFCASIWPQWASAESKEVLRSNSSPVTTSQLGTRPWSSHRVQAPTVGGCCGGVGGPVNTVTRRGTRTSPRILDVGSLYQTGWKSNFKVGLNR
jgi:hypothetical protein